MSAPITVVVRNSDGKRVHTLRQSSMKTIDTCLERARREMSGLSLRSPSDSSAVGTGVHKGIEVLCNAKRQGRTMSFLEALFVATDEFDKEALLPGMRFIKQKNTAGCHKLIERCLRTFYDQWLPKLHPMVMELGWGPLKLYEDDERVIYLTGTIDYLDERTGAGDWKTSDQEWKPWEHERWDIQPSVYTWACVQLGILSGPGPHPFTFYVMRLNGTFQKITVMRHVGDWEWLKERALSVAMLIEAELPSWPLNDNHALCSPKWCPEFASCKGKHYSGGWPRPSEPSGDALAAFSDDTVPPLHH